MKPDIIYAAASGFGQSGPYVDRPGQDLIIQALSGLAAITGHAGGWAACRRRLGRRSSRRRPVCRRHPRCPAAGASAPARAAGSTSACSPRRSTCRWNCSSASSTATARTTYARVRASSGWYYGAPYGIYPTADSFIAISLGSLKALYEALDVPADERVPDAEAYERREEAAQRVAAVLAMRSTAEWIETLTRHGIWHSAVNDYEGVVADPQVAHSGSFVTVEGSTGTPVTLVRHPVRYDGEAPGRPASAAAARRPDGRHPGRARLRDGRHRGPPRRRRRRRAEVITTVPPSTTGYDDHGHHVRRDRRHRPLLQDRRRIRRLPLCRHHRRLLGQPRRPGVHARSRNTASGSPMARCWSASCRPRRP